MTQVRQEPLEITLARLETFVSRMEQRFGFLSEQAAEAVDSGALRETAEVSRWLTSYRTLDRLKGHIAAHALSTTTSPAYDTEETQ